MTTPLEDCINKIATINSFSRVRWLPPSMSFGTISLVSQAAYQAVQAALEAGNERINKEYV